MSKFKTKARTIELLGRKQIRDSVTALAELMKNSYDADADWVRAYFNSNKDNIILVDNGMGMSQTDIEEKWLVLGTPSKNTAKRVSPKGRPYMGAKGIGRLAAASLGKHYIMITKTENSNYNIAYLFWDLFEDTTVSLDEIEIPTRYNIEKQTLMSSFTSIVDELVRIQLKNVEVYVNATFNPFNAEFFERSIANARENAQNIVKYLGLIDGKGTLLFMSELRDDWNSILVQDTTKLGDDLTADKNYKRFANFVSTLNSAYKKQEKCSNDFVEIFKNGQVMRFHDDYTEYDFEIYDIKFEGIIEKGVFRGKLYANNTDQEALIAANSVLASGIDISGGIENLAQYDCGPIRLKVCHIEGQKNRTSLTEEKFRYIRDKIDVLGGIGVYRDGVRVLPYGELENDYLEIERRRTNKAGVYVFSHRNIFGRIDISAEDNPRLEDKSSREGFIENNYYHYFINTLKNLLIKIAMDFLSDAHKNSYNIRTHMVKYYDQEVERQKEQEEYEKRERERFKLAVQDLKNKLQLCKQKILETEKIEIQISNIVAEIEKLSGIDLLENFLSLEQAFQSKERSIADIISSCIITIPDRFKTDMMQKEEKLHQDILIFNDSVIAEKKRLAIVIENAKNTITTKEIEFETALEERKTVEKQIEVLKRKVNRISSFVEQVFDDYLSKRGAVISELDVVLSSIKSNTNCEEQRKMFESKLDSMYQKLNSLNFETFSDKDYGEFDVNISQLQTEIEKLVDQLYGEFNSDLLTTNAVVQSISQLIHNRDLIGHDDQIIGSLKAENMALREEVDLYEDLANFGMASEILNHEFNQFYTKANDAITQLGSYLFDNTSRYWLKQIQIAFDAIYSRHSMLSPMYRIKSEKIKEHSLLEIVEGAVKLFEHTFDVEEIEVSTEKIPSDVTVSVLPSHLYPALSNVISNAVYWLAGTEKKKIWIHFVAEENALYIEDNGKGIQAARKEDIFNPFYSLKPNGRGLGLTITKRVLQKDGHDISVVEASNYKMLNGACFKIIFKRKDEKK